MVIVDRTGATRKLVTVDSFREVTGFDYTEFFSQSPAELRRYLPDFDRILETINRVIDTGRQETIRYMAVNKNGMLHGRVAVVSRFSNHTAMMKVYCVERKEPER